MRFVLLTCLLEVTKIKGMRKSRFADLLRQQREAAGLTQYALAKLSGLSRATLSALEMSEREPSWETVQRLAAALDVACEVFKDPGIQLPEVTLRKPGRPHKEPTQRKPRKKK
jgi:transcriptional regulator with XRE-family HTH domain